MAASQPKNNEDVQRRQNATGRDRTRVPGTACEIPSGIPPGPDSRDTFCFSRLRRFGV